MARILNFIKSPFETKKLIVHCLTLLWFIRLCLWCLPFRWINKRIAVPSRMDETGKTNWPKVTEIADTIKACSKYVPHGSCLTQAFATRLVLLHYGQQNEISIGVLSDAASVFKAHAWVEVEGRVVVGEHPDRSKFIVLRPPETTGS